MGQPTVIERCFTVKSLPSVINDVYNEVLAAMKTLNYNSSEVFSVHLALEEAFSNSMKHGNKMDPGKTIKVEYHVSEEKIELAISDEGQGFNPEGLPDPRIGENIYKANGRGVLLMRSYMDKVEYNRQGNSVYMVKYRKIQKQDEKQQ